jgi:predicted dinucleotide-binding enzyme
MRFGTIGAGTIGKALAHHVIKAGYPIVLSNSRGPSTLTETVTELGPLASAGTVAEAAQAWLNRQLRPIGKAQRDRNV